MFGESEYDPIFDSNHDGHFDSFERDHAECFLHDCDTFDQVIAKENLSAGGYRSGNKRDGKRREFTPEEIEELEKFMKTHPFFKPDSEKTFDERHPIIFPFLFMMFIIFCFFMLGVSASLGVH